MLLQEYGIRPWELDRFDEAFMAEFLVRHEEKVLSQRTKTQTQTQTPPPSPGRPGEVTEIAQIGNWNVAEPSRS